MTWCPFATRYELQPESDSQPAIRPTQFILHSIIAPWTAKRTYEYWRDSTSLESHFGLGYEGDLGQFVGTATRADANYQANRRPDGTGAVSMETASNLQGTDPWTDEQIEQIIRVGVWLHQEHDIPLRICRTGDDPGYGYHRLHPEWSPSGTACPGDARVKQFRDLVFPGIVAGASGATPAPEPPASEEDFVSLQKLYEPNPIDVTLESGRWLGLAFADAVLHAGPRQLVGPLYVHLTMAADTPADTRVTGQFYLTDPDGTNPSGYGDVDHWGPGGHQYLHNVDVPDGKHLRFRVKATTSGGHATLLIHRTAAGNYLAA